MADTIRRFNILHLMRLVMAWLAILCVLSACTILDKPPTVTKTSPTQADKHEKKTDSREDMTDGKKVDQYLDQSRAEPQSQARAERQQSNEKTRLPLNATPQKRSTTNTTVNAHRDPLKDSLLPKTSVQKGDRGSGGVTSDPSDAAPVSIEAAPSQSKTGIQNKSAEPSLADRQSGGLSLSERKNTMSESSILSSNEKRPLSESELAEQRITTDPVSGQTHDAHAKENGLMKDNGPEKRDASSSGGSDLNAGQKRTGHASDQLTLGSRDPETDLASPRAASHDHSDSTSESSPSSERSIASHAHEDHSDADHYHQNEQIIIRPKRKVNWNIQRRVQRTPTE